MQNIITPDFGQSPRSLATDAPAKVMLSVERDGNQTLVRINSSSLSLLQTCARKSFYSLKEGWKSKAGSPPLIFGSAVHKALEVFYSHPKSERTLPDNFIENAVGMAQRQPAPNSHFLYEAIASFLKEAETLQGLSEREPRSLVSGCWMLTHYFTTYLHDAYVIYSDASGPFTERTAEAVLYEDGGLKIIVFGTIDFILRNEVTGELLPGDHKTTSRMGADFFNRIKPNHQYTGYLYLANKALGMTCENFLVNGLGVKAKPVTPRGGPPTFSRQITNRSGEDFLEFKDAVYWAVTSYLEWSRTNIWPIGSVDACSSWGGCQFLEVCTAPNELRNNMLESKFERILPC